VQHCTDTPQYGQVVLSEGDERREEEEDNEEEEDGVRPEGGEEDDDEVEKLLEERLGWRAANSKEAEKKEGARSPSGKRARMWTRRGSMGKDREEEGEGVNKIVGC